MISWRLAVRNNDLFDAPPETYAAPELLPVHLHGVLAAQGGAAKVMRLLARGIARHGFAPQLSCEIKDSDDACVREISPLSLGAHVPPEHICHVHGSRNWPDLFRGFAELDQRVDFITMHDCALLTGGCIHPRDCPGWLEGCPGCCPQRYDGAISRQNALRYILLSMAPVLVTPSAWLRKMVRAALPDLKCVLIPNGVEDPLLTTDRQRARLSFGLNPGSRLLLFAAHGGALSVAKGGGDFLKVWRTVKAKTPEAVAFIVGGDELSREGDVYYWPYVDTAQMHRFLLASDLLIHTSLAENHSLLILEAMAASQPICAYNTGGIPEQVTDGETGFLAPLGDVAALTAAVQTLLNAPSQARDMGLRARVRYERNFRAERMVADYARLYESVLA